MIHCWGRRSREVRRESVCLHVESNLFLLHPSCCTVMTQMSHLRSTKQRNLEGGEALGIAKVALPREGLCLKVPHFVKNTRKFTIFSHSTARCEELWAAQPRVPPVGVRVETVTSRAGDARASQESLTSDCSQQQKGTSTSARPVRSEDGIS